MDPSNGSYVDEEIGGFYGILMDLGNHQMGKYHGNIMGIMGFYNLCYVVKIGFWMIYHENYMGINHIYSPSYISNDIP
jgi:hypothetical protein